MKKITIIEWLDAASHKDINRKELGKKKAEDYGVIRESIGWIVKEDKTGIVLCQDIDDSNDMEIVFIPAGMILSKKKLKVVL